VDAFEKVTGDVKVSYPLDGQPATARCRRGRQAAPGRTVTLMVRHVRRDPGQIVRHLVREIRDEQQSQLSYDVKVGECIFRREPAPGAAHGAGSLHLAPDFTAVPGSAEQERIRAVLDQIHDAYRHHCTYLAGDRLRGVIRTYIESLNAIKVRPTGGVYFVHRRHEPTAKLQRIAERHISTMAAARRALAAHRSKLAKLADALEEALDQIVPPYLRYRIRRWQELIALLLLTVAEVVVAETVVQALGLTATATDLVAVVAGAAATGLAWLVGHEWALAHDPQAMAAGRRSWLGMATATAAVFLAATWRCASTTACWPSRPATSASAWWPRYWPDPCSPPSPRRSWWWLRSSPPTPKPPRRPNYVGGSARSAESSTPSTPTSGPWNLAQLNDSRWSTNRTSAPRKRAERSRRSARLLALGR
jgi:hypothetical protein